MLVYHPESDSVFETSREEFEQSPNSFDKGLCEDVTGMPVYEDMYADREQIKKEEANMSRDAGAGAARESMREAARKRAEETTHGGGGFSINLPEGVKFFVNEGKRQEFDFIPYTISNALNADVRAGRRRVGDLVDACSYKMHRDIGAEQKSYICPTTFGKKCPICEAQVVMAKAAKSKQEIDDAKALKAKERVLYNIFDAADSKAPLMIWDVSYSLFTKQLEHEQREREEYYDYADPDNGYTVSIRFEERVFNRNKFFEADRIDFVKRKPLGDADLKAAVDLDACLQVLAYDQLEKVFLGIDGEPDAGGE
jgi:hypothetical protein